MIRILVFLVASNVFVASKDFQVPDKRSHGWNPPHCWDDQNRDPFCPTGLLNCTVAPIVDHGSHNSVYSRTINSTLTYTCDTGYYITGPEVITCVQSGSTVQWTATPVCNKGCDEAPEVDHGSHNKNYNRTLGATVFYVCDDGYYMKGPEVATCEKAGGLEPKWSETPQCIKATCPAVPEILYGFHETVNSTAIGTSVKYFCNATFEILDVDTIICELNVTAKVPSWSTPLPQCIGGCQLPSFSKGYILLPGMVVTTEGPVASTAAPTEPQVMTVTEMETTTTVPDTTTSEEATTTTEAPMTTTDQPVTTEEPVATTLAPEVTTDSVNTATDVFIKTKGTTVSASVIPNDEDDSNMTDSTTTNSNITDSMTTTTTPVPDTDMPDTTTLDTTAAPETTTTPKPTTTTTQPTTTTTTLPPTTQSPYAYIGNITTFRINETIIFQCNPGYTVISTANPTYVGSSVSADCKLVSNVTENGVVSRTTSWSTTAYCVPYCPAVEEVLYANHTIPANTRQGATVEYSCSDGFELVGTSQVTCLPTGKWSTVPFCRSCGPPPNIEHGTHNTDFTTVANSTVFYVCDDGFSMLGLEVVTCNTINRSPYGRWSDPPACTRSCGPVPTVENSAHTEPENTLTGANVTYACLDGYSMKGPKSIVCEPSGNWSTTPTCNKTCVLPPPVAHSKVSQYIYNETERVKLVCEDRYTLIGNDTLHCEAGHWSTPFPYCQCEIKPIDIVFIIDGSGSLGVHGFNQTLNFVIDMVSRFPIATTHFGLLTFSTGTFLQFYLNEYVNDTLGLNERIRNTTYPTGGTHTYEGLQFARTDMFTEANGMRPNVSHTAIVVTDGHSDNFNETVDQAQLLKDSGVTIYSVGVGLTDEKELQLIASNATYVFTVDNYDRIDEITGPLAGVTCASTHETTERDSLLQNI